MFRKHCRVICRPMAVVGGHSLGEKWKTRKRAISFVECWQVGQQLCSCWITCSQNFTLENNILGNYIIF